MTPNEMLTVAIKLLDWIAKENIDGKYEEPLQLNDIQVFANAASHLCLHAKVEIAKGNTKKGEG